MNQGLVEKGNVHAVVNNSWGASCFLERLREALGLWESVMSSQMATL